MDKIDYTKYSTRTLEELIATYYDVLDRGTFSAEDVNETIKILSDELERRNNEASNV